MRERLQDIQPPVTSEHGFVWYARPEPSGPWTVPACAEHGRALEQHRFRRHGPTLDRPGIGTRIAAYCEICRNPSLLDEIEGCWCEDDAARCPVHQNIGCGG